MDDEPTGRWTDNWVVGWWWVEGWWVGEAIKRQSQGPLQVLED